MNWVEMVEKLDYREILSTSRLVFEFYTRRGILWWSPLKHCTKQLAKLHRELHRIEGREISTLLCNEVKCTVWAEGKNYIYLVRTRSSEIFMVFGLKDNISPFIIPALGVRNHLNIMPLCSIFNSCLVSPSIITSVEGCKGRGVTDCPIFA